MFIDPHIEASRHYRRFAAFFRCRHSGIWRHSSDWRVHARKLYPEQACALDGIEPASWGEVSHA